ncbi:hypothetical protein JXB37_07095 [candidate division WOR-3 bacterium]|nr:hypothetical protein [candidate division WOR-3 bacterium]
MKTTAVIALLLLAVAPGSGSEPWQQLAPPGFDVAGMATVPGYPDEAYLVAAGQPARVYHTSNLGLNWTMLDTIQDALNDILVRPDQVDIVFAIGERGLVYRSANGGLTWFVRGTLDPGAAGRRLAFKPGQPTTMWAAAELADLPGIGVFASTDGGTSWSGAAVDSGPNASAVLLHADPYRANRVFIGGRLGNRARLYRSENGGADWSDVSTGLGGTCAWDVAACPTDPSILVCATDAGIYRSSNSGSSWQLREAVPAWSVEFAAASPHTGYAGSDNLVFRSSDNGNTWLTETTDFRGSRTTRLAVNPSQALEIYAGNGVGMFHSSNGGFDWSELTGGFEHLTVPWLSFYPQAPDTLYACPDGFGPVRSSDRGVNWSRLPAFAGDGFTNGIAVNPRDQDTIYCVTSFDARLWRTTDRGDSWEPRPVVDRFVARGITYHPVEPDTMYAWGGQRDSDAGRPLFRVYRSSDGGENWTRILARGFESGLCRGLLFSPNPDTVYAWGEADGSRALYRTTDRGGTWTSVASGVSGNAIRDFALSPVDRGTWFAATANGTFRTTDHGETWDDLGLSHCSTVLPDTASIDAVLVGTDTAGLYHTANAGIFWDRDTVGLPSRAILELHRHPDLPAAVYCCASGAGILARGVVGVAETPASRTPTAGLRPTLVRAGAVVCGSFAPGDRTALHLYTPDGRHAAGPLPFHRTRDGLAWTRPAGLSPGVYLLTVETGHRQVFRVVLSP